MRLPNAENSVVDELQLSSYLLNSDHPHGNHKARFLCRFGFTSKNLQEAAHAFLEHGRTHEVSGVVQTGFGPRYSVDGRLKTPDGRNPLVRTIWQMDTGEVAPRMITAYPLRK